jgi:hypothetical protein
MDNISVVYLSVYLKDSKNARYIHHVFHSVESGVQSRKLMSNQSMVDGVMVKILPKKLMAKIDRY